MRAMLVPLCLLAAIVPAVTTAADPSGPPLSGEALFAGKCAHCHGRGGWGTRALARRMPLDQAELLERRAVSAALVRYVVRRGIGSMPQFTPTDLTDEQLERLAQWLETRR